MIIKNVPFFHFPHLFLFTIVDLLIVHALETLFLWVFVCLNVCLFVCLFLFFISSILSHKMYFFLLRWLYEVITILIPQLNQLAGIFNFLLFKSLVFRLCNFFRYFYKFPLFELYTFYFWFYELSLF